MMPTFFSANGPTVRARSRNRRLCLGRMAFWLFVAMLSLADRGEAARLDWEGDRAQAVAACDVELGLLVAQWHRRKRPEVTMTELARILAGQVTSALKYAVRTERAAQEQEEDGTDG